MKIYALFPTNNIDSLIDTQAKNDGLLEEVRLLIYRIYHEKNALLHYDGENLEEFIELLESNSEIEGFGIMDIATVLYLTLQDAKAIVQSYTNDEKCIFKIWDFHSQALSNNYPKILEAYVDEELKENNNKCLFLNYCFAFDIRGIISIFKDCKNNIRLPRFIHIKQEDSFFGLDNWLINNRVKRNYNKKDNRHVENHPDYRKGKSPIIGGEGGKDQLENLLPFALTDKQGKDLIAYDTTTKCFVWYEFENDNPQNQYHGYHLAIPSSHRRDLEAERNVPEEVAAIFRFRRKWLEKD